MEGDGRRNRLKGRTWVRMLNAQESPSPSRFTATWRARITPSRKHNVEVLSQPTDFWIHAPTLKSRDQAD